MVHYDATIYSILFKIGQDHRSRSSRITKEGVTIVLGWDVKQPQNHTPFQFVIPNIYFDPSNYGKWNDNMCWFPFYSVCKVAAVVMGWQGENETVIFQLIYLIKFLANTDQRQVSGSPSEKPGSGHWDLIKAKFQVLGWENAVQHDQMNLFGLGVPFKWKRLPLKVL